jgi:hypothetical protein
VKDDWIDDLVGGPPPGEGNEVTRHGLRLARRNEFASDIAIVAADQTQTCDMLAPKWAQKSSHGSEVKVQIASLESRDGGWDFLAYRGRNTGRKPVVLNAGAGSDFTSKLMLRARFHRFYVAADISAIIAASNVKAKALEGFSRQADLVQPPITARTYDIVMPEGASPAIEHFNVGEASVTGVARRPLA